MARIRTVKPEFWSHEELSALPEATHLLAAALLNYSDDYGYFNANIALVKAACSPIREPSVSIPESFRSLQTIGYLRLGRGPDGKNYGHIVNFEEHQRVSHPTPSKIAELTITWSDSGSSPENLGNPPEQFRPERKGKEGKGRTPTRSRKISIPDDFTLTEDLREYAAKHLPDADIGELFEGFCGKARSKGWQYASWPQAWQEFVRNAKPNSGHFSAGQYPKAGAGGVRWM